MPPTEADPIVRAHLPQPADGTHIAGRNIMRNAILATALVASFLFAPTSAKGEQPPPSPKCSLVSLDSAITIPANAPAVPFIEESLGVAVTGVSVTSVPAIPGLTPPTALRKDPTAGSGAWLLSLPSPLEVGSKYDLTAPYTCEPQVRGAPKVQIIAGPSAPLPTEMGTLVRAEPNEFSRVVTFTPSASLKPYLPVAMFRTASNRQEAGTRRYGEGSPGTFSYAPKKYIVGFGGCTEALAAWCAWSSA